VWTCLALTWLNPHVYLDTVLLLGSIAASHGSQRWTFGVGARLLTEFFARPGSWRVLDSLIAALMTVLGATMVARTLL
jgi:L-lysine exporter family protein LysE/ArgO